MFRRILFLLWISPVALAFDTSLEQPLGVHDAVHLLQRVGIGAEPLLVAELAPLSRSIAIDLLVDGIQTQSTIAMPEWVTAPAPAYWARGDMPKESRRAFNRARDREMSDLRRWWVAEMISTPSPQTERLVLMWHNHFVSAYSGINEESTSIARQNQMFRELGLGNFRQLLHAVIRDPAMLNYLDNRSNKKRSPNENLARELLELFTLGEGQYSETTVKEAARALTGYTVAVADDMSFVLESWHHDKGDKSLFGQSGAFNADDLIEIILQQDAASRHIARLFWRQYISEFTVDETAIDELAASFRHNDYELRELLLATLQRPEFWSQEFRGQIVKSPVDLLIGTMRSVDFVPKRWDALPAQLARLGQTLFDPPNVAGWSGGAAWVTPAKLLNRQLAVEQIFASKAQRKQARKLQNQALIAPADDEASMMSSAAAEPSMTMMNAGDDALAKENQMSLRVAAENFRGAPEVQLVLRQGDALVWRSDEVELVSGHDTEQFGRISASDLMPWETVLFDVPLTAKIFDRIEVHFTNDAAGDGGDRNLYVDWVEYQDQYFYARDGLQNSRCPPKTMDQAGNLYCTGHVSIPLESASGTLATTQPHDQLLAAHAHTLWFQKLKADANWRQLVIGLTDVHLDRRHWNTITIALVSSKDLGPGLQFSTNNCVEDCFTTWPDCAWTDELNLSYRAVYFPVKRTDANAHLDCHWESLSAEDQRLVGSIFNVLPQLVKHVSKGRKAQRRSGEFSAWIDAVDTLSGQLNPQYKVTDVAKRVVLTGENIAATTSPLALSVPVVGSRSAGLNAKSLESLLRGERDLPLLLSVAPVLEASDDRDLGQMMADPAFQVK